MLALLRRVRSTSLAEVVDDYCFDSVAACWRQRLRRSSKQPADSATTARFAECGSDEPLDHSAHQFRFFVKGDISRGLQTRADVSPISWMQQWRRQCRGS
ncbi:MAG: hypothetical protein ACLP0J_27910 [Solirubrobacteraceae bacterium]